MGPWQITRYVFRDTVNRRSGLEVFAGIATVAVATAITVLCLAFSNTAEELVDKAIEPTRPVAGVVVLKAKGQFTTPAVAEIESRLAEAKALGEVQAVAFRVTTIEFIDLPLAKHFGGKLNDPFIVWCVPYDSPLLQPELGLKVRGKVFSRKDKPRFGCLVNLSYLKPYMGLERKQADKLLREQPCRLWQIRLLFRTLPDPDGDVPIALPDDCRLTVTGWFDEPSYPPLILTEDVAGAYFSQIRSADNKVKGEFPSTLPFHFYDQELDSPLIDAAQLKLKPSIVGSLPDKDGLLAFSTLKNAGLSPYDEAAVYLRDWKTEGTRERFRKTLMEPHTLNVAADVPVHELVQALAGGDREAVSRLVTKATELPLSTDLLIRKIVSSEGFDQQFEISDIASQLLVLAQVKGDEIKLQRLPGYEVLVPQFTLTNSLIRVRTIIARYRTTVIIIVGVLGFFATFLLAFCHVLRKSRDIGLLFINGARRRTVLALFLGEVLWIAFVGVLLGLTFAWLGRPVLEWFAMDVLRGFSSDVAEFVPEGTRLLAIGMYVIFQSVALVMGATLAGSLYPAFRATRTAPLISLNGGD